MSVFGLWNVGRRVVNDAVMLTYWFMHLVLQIDRKMIREIDLFNSPTLCRSVSVP